MKSYSKKYKFLAVLTVGILIVSSLLPSSVKAAETKVKETVKTDEFTVSKGVKYKDIRIKKETIIENDSTDKDKKDDIKTDHNAIRVLEINTKNPDVSVQLGRPDNLTVLKATTSLALDNHYGGNYVVGAINGSFSHITTTPRFPMSLIAENNRLIFGGEIGGYINNPIAFGMDKNGKGLIDYYDLQLSYEIDGNTYPIKTVNRPRSVEGVVLYNKDFYSDVTETNEYGQEIAVVLEETPTFEFGDTYTGEVVSFRNYGDKSKTVIPENGFVLSVHGSTQFKDINLGDTISVSVNIDAKWKHADYMLAAGPMLVKDGKVNLTMNANSSRARETAPRSAIAVDKTGEKIYFITVDGRQAGYSKGMNLTQFAEYLVSLGVDRALNLDGGGSTTMAIRKPGDTKVGVANSPSDGRQRGVSTILMAVTKENGLYYKDISPGKTHYDGVRWLSERGINGYPDGKFGVGNELTRPHAAIMFTHALGLTRPDKKVVEEYFNDVTAKHLYADFIAATAQAGIFKGSNGNFLPDTSLTREQMASTLVNAFGLESTGEQKKIFLDNVDGSHKANVQILADLGITNQLDDFRPKEIVTRGQFATFLYLSMKYKESLEEVVEEPVEEDSTNGEDESGKEPSEEEATSNEENSDETEDGSESGEETSVDTGEPTDGEEVQAVDGENEDI